MIREFKIILSKIILIIINENILKLTLKINPPKSRQNDENR